MSDEFVVEASADPKKRCLQVLDAWREAPKGSDVEMRIGRSTDGEPAVCVSFGGQHHAFTTEEAKVLTNILRETIQKYPRDARKEGLPELKAGLETCIQMTTKH